MSLEVIPGTANLVLATPMPAFRFPGVALQTAEADEVLVNGEPFAIYPHLHEASVHSVMRRSALIAVAAANASIVL